MYKARGDWMETYTGRQFWPLNPMAADVDIEDIAHSLSNICRFNGHVREFYSVAQHCVQCAALLKTWGASLKIQAAGLLHDASEAYLCDVIRPVKRNLPSYGEYEFAVLVEVGWRFQLSIEQLSDPLIQKADDVMLMTEADQLLPSRGATWSYRPCEPLSDWVIDPWTPRRAKAEFLKLAEVLCLINSDSGVRHA